jgi:hypothetical protein
MVVGFLEFELRISHRRWLIHLTLTLIAPNECFETPKAESRNMHIRYLGIARP